MDSENQVVPEAQGEQHEIAASEIDLNALWVVRRLRAKGFEAYLTGGCVRDLLLGKHPKDFDVATNAKPEEVKRIFRNCRLIGRRFLLAHIFFPGGKIIETATFRANPTDVQEDLPEDLLLKQDNVYGSIEEDARRRDLTINGLFYDPVAGKVIDYVGGREDLNARLIRSIGDPEIRFQEDPVRILRAIKFASRLDFQFEEKTLAAMRRHVGEIPRCAPARVQEEIMRLLGSGHAETAISMCRDIGVLDVLLPELMEGLTLELQPKAALAEGEMLPTALTLEHRKEQFGGLLRALDQAVSREVDIPAAVGFALMLLPGYQALELSSQNERSWLDKLCVSWSERIRLARHDQDRIRLLLSSVELFAPEKLAQKSSQFMVRKPWFKEALLLNILYLYSRGEPLEQIGVWKALAQEAGKSYRQDRKGERAPRPKFRRRRPQGRARPRHHSHS